jgi:hypothetical protein
MPSDARVIEYQRDPEDAPDTTGAKQDTRFKPGQSGNPNGRPRGSRSKLGDQFLQDLFETWQEHGRQALETCAKKEPVQFAKLVSNVLPKQVVETAFSVSANVSMDVASAREFLQAYRTIRIDAARTIDAEPVEGAIHTEAAGR